MKLSNCNKLLRNWILVLLCCTLAGIMLDILFSRQEISPHIHSNKPQKKHSSEENPSENAFDSIRNMYMISGNLNTDSIKKL